MSDVTGGCHEVKNGDCFSLNLSFAIISYFLGLAFNSSAVLADAVHDTGMHWAIGLSTLLEKIYQKEDSRYTLGYKRYSLLGAILTSIILITGSLLVLWEYRSQGLLPRTC